MNLIECTGFDNLFTVNLVPVFQSHKNKPLSGSEPNDIKYDWTGDSIIYWIPNLCPFRDNYGIISFSSYNLKIFTQGLFVAYSPVNTWVPSLEISTALTDAFPSKKLVCWFKEYEYKTTIYPAA